MITIVKDCILYSIALTLMPLAFIYAIGIVIYFINKLVNKKGNYSKYKPIKRRFYD
jgi:hypothetical protein